MQRYEPDAGLHVRVTLPHAVSTRRYLDPKRRARMGLTRGERRIVESVHDRLGFSYAEIAEVLGADESSLHRWRKGGRGPAGIFGRQIAALGRCLEQMCEVVGEDGLGVWATTRSPALDGASPKTALLRGEIDRVALAIQAQRFASREGR